MFNSRRRCSLPARVAPLWAALCVVALVAIGMATSVASRELERPMEFRPSRKGNTNVNLSVRAHRVSIPLSLGGNGGKDDDEEGLFFEYTGRFYYVEGKKEPLLPGPTIIAKPGGKIKLTVKNELGLDSADQTARPLNSYHRPNTTNVHFHGVHGDPAVDDPFTTVGASGQLFYKLSLPRDHEPGLHWYHSHSHGASYQQVMGGLFGAIVIGEGSWLVAPKHPFRDWDDTVLLFHLYRLGPSAQCDGATMQKVDTDMASNTPANPRVVTRAGKEHDMPADLYLVNGQHRPTVAVVVGRPNVFRMAFAAGSCHLNITAPPKCVFHVFALDGVQTRRTRERRWLYFTTATRVEAAVVCREAGTFPVTLSHSRKEVLFFITASTGGGKKAPAEVAFPVTIPKYSPDYLYMDGPRVARRDISFSQLDLPAGSPLYVMGQGEDCSSLRNSSTCYYEAFGGRKGADTASYHGFAVPRNTVLTARVFGDPADPVAHPLHLHVNHFQVLSFTPRPGGLHANHTLEMYGIARHQVRDTIPIMDGVTVIRWQAATFLGEVAYHCHSLSHEDRGMMLSYLVYPDWAPPPPAHRPAASSATSWHAVSAALFAVLLISAALALTIVGLRWYHEHPDRNYTAYYTTPDDAEMGVRTGSPSLARMTEATPLVPRK